MELMDAKDAAKYVGVFSYWTILQLAQQGKVPHIRVGRRVFFRAEALDSWIRGIETGGIRKEDPPERGVLRRVQP